MTLMVDRNEKMANIPVPLRGMNTKDPPHHLPEGQGTDLYNVEIDEIIGIEKRNGFTPFNTASTVLPRYNSGTIREITGAMVYGSGTAWTASMCKTSDVLMMFGNSSVYYWQIENLVGTATISLYNAYTQTVTASSYVIAPREIGSIFSYKYATTQKLMAFAGSDAYSATNGLTGSFTRLSAGLTDYAKVAGITFQDNFYFCNGYEFKYYDGSSIANVAGTPDPNDPKYVGLYTIGNANFIWIGGAETATDYSKFAFSDVNAPGTWPSANVYYAGDRDGQKITGGKPIPGGWAIFKDNSIYVFAGIPGSGTLRKVVDDVGCLSPRSLVAYEGQVYFVGKQGGKLGAFSFNGSSVTLLSESIETTLNEMKASGFDDFCGEIYQEKYVISGISASGSYSDRHFICYIRRPFQSDNRIYFPWTYGNRGYNFLVNNDVSGTNYLFSASPTNGFVYREDTGTSDDTTDNIFGGTSAIDSYCETGWIDFGDISRKKELLRLYIDATSSGEWNLALKIYFDFSYGYNQYDIDLGTNVLAWSEVVYLVTQWQQSVTKLVTEVPVNFPSIAKHFKFRWGNSNINEYFSVYPMSAFYKLENR